MCFKDKESNEKVLVFYKDKTLMKVQGYVKKLSDIYFLWNVKFYGYKSYNILWEEVYEEKLCYSLRCFKFKTKLPIIWFKLQWLFCNENIYMYICIYVCMYVCIWF